MFSVVYEYNVFPCVSAGVPSRSQRLEAGCITPDPPSWFAKRKESLVLDDASRPAECIRASVCILGEMEGSWMLRRQGSIDGSLNVLELPVVIHIVDMIDTIGAAERKQGFVERFVDS
ncbi:hypothetical protein Fuma_04797 [Fuerstiella marisgermanici]|uniref:Uncharacterized protein n=1 Tax=Fuerstiella marisgermanici TaxID=1891926 RepID=A0A1P8WM54_9PLAN|nr:hypothetical protein Fuma_04797 [Fuerstiella marisgermanici]